MLGSAFAVAGQANILIEGATQSGRLNTSDAFAGQDKKTPIAFVVRDLTNPHQPYIVSGNENEILRNVANAVADRIPADAPYVRVNRNTVRSDFATVTNGNTGALHGFCHLVTIATKESVLNSLTFGIFGKHATASVSCHPAATQNFDLVNSPPTVFLENRLR